MTDRLTDEQLREWRDKRKTGIKRAMADELLSHRARVAREGELVAALRKIAKTTTWSDAVEIADAALSVAQPADGATVIVSAADEVTLAECPIGLFTFGDELCLKTEYGNNDGRIDTYIVSSGEFFWGSAPQTIASQRSQIVRPVSWTWGAPREQSAATSDGEAARTLLKRLGCLDDDSNPFPDDVAFVLAALRQARAEAQAQEREACAKIADRFRCGSCGMDGKAAAAIRSQP